MEFFTLANLIGFTAFGLAMMGYLQRCTKISLYFLSAASLAWGFHYIALGEIAFLIGFVNCGRTFLCAQLTSLKRRTIVIAFATTLSFILIVPRIETAVDMIPLMAIVMVAIAMILRQDFTRHKALMMLGECTWCFYACLIGSLPLACATLLSAFMILYSLARHYGLIERLIPARL